MLEAGEEAVGAAAQAADGEAECPARLVEVVTAAVLQLAALEQIPDARVGIELRRLGGQPFEVQPLCRPGGEEILDRLAAVDRRAIPDHEPLAAHLAPQLPEKGDERRPAERLRLDVGEEPAIRRPRPDHGAMVVGEGRAQQRRRADRSVGAGDERQPVEAGLIDEEERARLGLGFARRAGQVSAGHAAIAASLRCVARTTGFCRLNPSRRTSRRTCAGW